MLWVQRRVETGILSWVQSRLYDFSSVILRNLGVDCGIDPGWEFLEQEWKKEKDLFPHYFVLLLIYQSIMPEVNNKDDFY